MLYIGSTHLNEKGIYLSNDKINFHSTNRCFVLICAGGFSVVKENSYFTRPLRESIMDKLVGIVMGDIS